MLLELDWDELSLAEKQAVIMDKEAWGEEISRLTPQQQLFRLYDWSYWRRPDQKKPDGEWYVWLLDAGRGSGKTRTGAETVRSWVEEARDAKSPIQIAMIAETKADNRDVMLRGPSGLLNISPPWFYPNYEPSNRRVTWPDGSYAILFSGDEPNQLRGPQFHKAWVDELAKYLYPQECWDMLELGLRLGSNPQAVVTTTPRNIPVIKALLADPQVRVTQGNSYRNLANLSPRYIQRVIRRYEGTRLGRQEIFAELLEDTPGALWNLDLLDVTRVAKAPVMRRIVVGVDPAVTSNKSPHNRIRTEITEDDDQSNETGIVVAGLGNDGHGYVFRDVSGIYSPREWGQQAANQYINYHADRIVGERNNGGEMVAYTVNTILPNIPVKLVWASRGKFARAEPIAALYEQHRIHHVGVLGELEDQMTTWTPDVRDWSPDRMDAAVWALSELFFGNSTDTEAGNWRTVRQ